MEPEFVLETRGLTKEFRGFTAVDSVDLKVRQGHIHALIGPSRAGKTTVFNLLTKFLTPTRGEILYRGKNITSMKANEIARLGLVRSFQISRSVRPHERAGERARRAAAEDGHLLPLLEVRTQPARAGRSGDAAARRGRPAGLRPDPGRRAALRPQARAGAGHHPGAGPHRAAARRTDPGHGW